MSTQTKNGSNGTAQLKTIPNGKEVSTVVTLPVKKEAAIPKDDLPPLEDRIHSVLKLTALVDKLEALQEAKKKLKAFKLSSDGSRDSLRLVDSKGNEFSTSNTAVITSVIDVMKTTIDQKISETEKQIRF